MQQVESEAYFEAQRFKSYWVWIQYDAQRAKVKQDKEKNEV